MENLLDQIKHTFPCREKLIKELYSLIGDNNDQMCDAIYLYGQSGIGKSTAIQHLLKSGIVDNYVIMNCVECYSPEILYEGIIDQLYDHHLTPENGYKSYAKCKNMMTFLRLAKKLDDTQRYIIVLENAEELRDMEFNMLPCFVKLQELTGLNICTIFVSTIEFVKYHSKTSALDVISVYVNVYSKDEMKEILRLDYKNVQNTIRENISNDDIKLEILDTLNEDFYENYINVLLTVLFRVTRDVNELKSIAKFCYEKYIQPVLERSIEQHDVLKLWKLGEPTLLNVLRKYQIGMYLADSTVQISSNSSQISQLELPYYTKYLLIAAFLASNNPVKEDKKLFVKKSSKKKKSGKVKAKVTEKMNTQMGPQGFTIDRLLSIFYSILDEKVNLNAKLLGQISNLVHLRLLRFVSGENNILEGTARLQCTVGLEFILHVGKTLQFNVRQYLCDFI